MESETRKLDAAYMWINGFARGNYDLSDMPTMKKKIQTNTN